MRHLCDFACFLAKQVLSQLSYTPTVGTAIDFKAFTSVRKLRKATFLPCVPERARASADFIRETQAGPQTAWALRIASGNGI